VAFLWSTTQTPPPVKPSPVVESPIVNPGLVEPNIFATIFGAIIVVAIIALSIYVLLKAPLAVARGGKKTVQSVVAAAAPIVLHVQHQPDTPRRRAKVIIPLTMAANCILIIIPLVFLLMAGQWANDMVDPALSWTIGLWLSGFSVVFFVSQYGTSRLFKLKSRDIT
jgi:hypothetical protein